jgi:maleylacetate reductase
MALLQFAIHRGGVRVVFGRGAAGLLGAEVAALGCARVLVVCSPTRQGEALALTASLGARRIGVCALAREHVPRQDADAAAREASVAGADCVLAVGGGSPIGLAKAVALALPVRVAALPTTYAGSEMTSIFGVSEQGEKRTGRDERVRPALVVYDPELTLALPAATSVVSALNAVAHAVEALYAAGIDPTTQWMAEESLRCLAPAIGEIRRAPRDLDARERALHGAHLAGSALGAVAMGLHHRACHVLGGSFGLPHAPTHAALLPYVMAFNAPAAADAASRVARALGAGSAARGLFELARQNGAPTDLRSLGLREADLDEAARRVAEHGGPNPRPASAADVREILQRAWSGVLAPAPEQIIEYARGSPQGLSPSEARKLTGRLEEPDEE